MKLLMCRVCGDTISPHRQNLKPRTCECGEYSVWWVNGAAGVLEVRANRGNKGHAWVLGINNSFLTLPEPISAHDIKRIDDECPDSYIFKRIHSPIIRIRPGQSNDTSWWTPPSIGEDTLLKEET